MKPYKEAQWGQNRRTRRPSNWFSSTNPLVWEDDIQWPSHIRSILAVCSVLLKESSERFDCRGVGLRKYYKITRWYSPLTVASLKEKKTDTMRPPEDAADM